METQEWHSKWSSWRRNTWTANWVILWLPQCERLSQFSIITVTQLLFECLYYSCQHQSTVTSNPVFFSHFIQAQSFCLFIVSTSLPGDNTTLMTESEEELKSLLMKVKEEREKIGLKLNIQKTKIMASGSIISWQIDGETMETGTDFIFGGSKITADGDCSHEIKRCLLPGRKVMTNLDSILKSRNITLPKRSI